jgi:hypothetical protein
MVAAGDRGKTAMMIGTGSYTSEQAAKAAMKALAECKRRSPSLHGGEVSSRKTREKSARLASGK